MVLTWLIVQNMEHLLPSVVADGTNFRTFSEYFSVFLFERSKFGFGTSGLGALENVAKTWNVLNLN